MVDSPLRETAIVARVGLALGCTITICFITGLLCHLVLHPVSYLPVPTRPVWLTRVTQGLHIVAGVVLVPLTLVKLWLVYPKLFARPVLGSIRRVLERLSIAVLVGSLIFQISTGMMFISLRLVVFDFFAFDPMHYTMSWVIVGAVCVHIAVKLDVITAAFGRAGRTSKRVAAAVGGRARREALTLAGLGAALASLMIVGQSVPAFRRISLFAPRSGDGPQGIPVNGTVSLNEIKVEVIADPTYQLEVVARGRACQFTRQQLAEMRQHTWDLPIVCAEGWSRSGTWTGVPIRDLLARVGVEDDPEVLVESVQQDYRPMRLPSHSVADPMTLLALELNGEPLSYDHGYPFRIIAPNRIGVVQTKWVKRIEVLA